MRKIFHFKKSQRGQSLVELALSLMVVLMLLMGAIDFGIALFAYVSMRDAAQEGAVYGSIEPDDTAGIIDRTIAAADDIIVIEEGDITISYSDEDNLCEGDTDGVPHKITVMVEHDHPVSTPLVGAMIGSQTISLRVQVTNTILSPVCGP